jgi:raffinose/stachyose/melibiose transport system permease protein
MKKLPKILTHTLLWIYVIISLYPIFFAFNNSFKKNIDIIDTPFALPTAPIIKNYIDAWFSSKISTFFLNSLWISTFCSAVSIILAAMVAYAVTRMRYRTANKYVNLLFGFSLLISGGFLIIPLYGMLTNLHLLNSWYTLLFPYITFGIPLTTFIIAAFLKAFPAELEEAGVMDGLSAFGLFWKIVMPLTIPALVTVFILNFLGNWNEFIMANFFVNKDKFRTLPVGMAAFGDKLNLNYGGLFASTMFSVIPVVIIYAFLQEKIIDGLTAGSVKG